MTRIKIDRSIDPEQMECFEKNKKKLFPCRHTRTVCQFEDMEKKESGTHDLQLTSPFFSFETR